MCHFLIKHTCMRHTIFLVDDGVDKKMYALLKQNSSNIQPTPFQRIRVHVVFLCKTMLIKGMDE